MAFGTPVVIFRSLLVNSLAVIAYFAPSAPRVYGTPGIPRALINSMPTAAITLLQSGGPEHPDIPLGFPAIAMKCYGSTTLAAMELYAIVEEFLGDMTAPVAGRRLQNQIVTISGNDYYVYSIRKSTGPMDVMEPAEGWPYIWSTYLMQYWQRPM